jgi:hypothetical protein
MFIKEINIFRTYLLLVEDALCAPSIAILLMLVLFPPTLALAEGAEQRPRF